jgi:hypothetical protein
VKTHLIALCLHFCSAIIGQERILVLGNSEHLCLNHSNGSVYSFTDHLPGQLDSFDIVAVFSTAHSNLSKENLDTLVSFLRSGGGLYIGCENWPLLSEGNQLTYSLLNKTFWGESTLNYSVEKDTRAVALSDIEHIEAGTTVVHFPLDHRLVVEVWSNDEPLILSSEAFGGRLILDGGYSRFYCNKKDISNIIWKKLIEYLSPP